MSYRVTPPAIVVSCTPRPFRFIRRMWLAWIRLMRCLRTIEIVTESGSCVLRVQLGWLAIPDAIPIEWHLLPVFAGVLARAPDDEPIVIRTGEFRAFFVPAWAAPRVKRAITEAALAWSSSVGAN